MVGAAQHDPVAAIILHFNPSDIEFVIVDGVVRKSAGKLVNVDVDKRAKGHINQLKLSWEDVASEVIKRRVVLQKKIEQVDMPAATEALIDQWYLDRSKLVGEL